MESNAFYYRRRAVEERMAAQRSMTEQARAWHSKLAEDFAARASACGAQQRRRSHRLTRENFEERNRAALAGRRMARPERFELPTPKFVVWCSIQLSYGRVPGNGERAT